MRELIKWKKELGTLGQKVLSDVSIQVLRADPISAEHIGTRIKEIIEESLSSGYCRLDDVSVTFLAEKEAYIQQLQHELGERDLQHSMTLSLKEQTQAHHHDLQR